jgi:hypothetical protein
MFQAGMGAASVVGVPQAGAAGAATGMGGSIDGRATGRPSVAAGAPAEGEPGAPAEGEPGAPAEGEPGAPAEGEPGA